MLDEKRLAYLESMDLRQLRNEARMILDLLDKARERVLAAKQQAEEAQERSDAIETALTLTEAYSAGKNAEIRAAWLKSQRTQDAELAAALGTASRLRDTMAMEEASREHLSRAYQLTLAEIHLAAAELAFLAE